jgi:hypothetical protein
MNVGNWVKVVKQPVKYNAHIKMLGYVGQVTDLNEDAAQIECLNGGMGACDIDCLEIISEPNVIEKEQLRAIM